MIRGTSCPLKPMTGCFGLPGAVLESGHGVREGSYFLFGGHGPEKRRRGADGEKSTKETKKRTKTFPPDHVVVVPICCSFSSTLHFLLSLSHFSSGVPRFRWFLSSFHHHFTGHLINFLAYPFWWENHRIIKFLRCML